MDLSHVHAEKMRFDPQGFPAKVESVAGQVQIDVDEVEFPALDEQLEIAALVPIGLGDPTEIGGGGPLSFQVVEEGSERKAVFVPELRDLRRAVLVRLVAPGDVRVIRRQEGRGESYQDHDD